MKKLISNFASYLSPEFIDKLKRVSKFLLVYTIAYFFLIAGIKYAIPLVIAYLFAISLRPLKNKILKINKLFKKERISDSLVAGILTLLTIAILISIIIALGYQIIEQLRGLYDFVKNPDNFNNIITVTTQKIQNFMGNISSNNPEISDKINQTIQSLVSKITSLLAVFFQSLLNFVVAIPTTFILVVITIISTFFITKDIEKINRNIKNIFSDKGKEVLEKLNKRKTHIFTGYIKAFSIIMVVLCVYTVIVYKIAGVEYALVLGILTAVIDALPLFGAGLFYGVLAILSFTSGDIKGAVILIIGYIGCVVIRQYLEQKLVSSFLGVHPLVIIVAIFLAFTPFGILGSLYFLGAFLLYEVFYTSK